MYHAEHCKYFIMFQWEISIDKRKFTLENQAFLYYYTSKRMGSCLEDYVLSFKHKKFSSWF